MSARLRWSRWLLALLALGCGSSGSDEEEGSTEKPLFPTGYRDDYVEVRSCRPSGDHELNNVRVLSNPSAADAYVKRNVPFAEGDVLLKEEYDFGDTSCTGSVKGWTLMKRTASQPAQMLGWKWQMIDWSRRVVASDVPRCYGCHTSCGVPPDGHEGSCGLQ
jgi:hypothetical protein